MRGLAALLAVASCSGTDSVGPSDLTLEPGSTTSLAGHAGEAAAPAPQVVVRHDNGTPAADVRVTFSVAAGSGTVAQEEVTTGATGLASPGAWVLGSTSGSQWLTATSPSIPGRSVTFTATVTAGPPTRLAFVVPPSLAAVGHPITPAIQVEITDDFGNRITGNGPDVTLALAAGAGAAGLAGTLTTAAQDGVATFPDLRVNQAGTRYRLSASAAGLPAVTSVPFDVVTEGSPAMAPFEGDDQTAGVGTAVPIAPAVKLLAGAGNPVAGVSVTFTANNGGAVTGGVATTGSDGIARVGSWTLGAALGTQTLTATANSATVFEGNPVEFSATAIAGPPSAGNSTLETLQNSITAGSGVATIRVTARDQYGNPVSGAAVTLAASGTGNTLDQPPPTGADGKAEGTLRSTVAETKVVTATVGGGAIPDQDAINVTPGPVASISISPSPQVSVDAGSTVQLAAATQDAFGNAVTGASVAWQTLDATVATVSSTGVVTGVAPISTTITAQSNGKSASVLLAVYGATTRLGLTYCTPGGTAVKLDVYFPSKTFPRPRPAVVYIHGGGWVSGNSTGAPELAELRQKLLDRGYVFLSLNYRHGPTHKWPAQGQDVRCAIRFLRANAFAYGINQAMILAVGRSAGGHLASFLATRAAPGFVDINQHTQYSSQVQGVASMAGVYDLTRPSELRSVPQHDSVFVGWPADSTSDYIRGASPLRLVPRAPPPFLLLHGEFDADVLPAQALRMNSVLADSGGTSSLVIVEDADHGFSPVPPASTTNPTFSGMFTMIVAFFDSVVSGMPAPVASPRLVRLESRAGVAPEAGQSRPVKRRFLEPY
ncbi:MAG: Ig-like domain-containing protein [Gemmatimonadales bacterium]